MAGFLNISASPRDFSRRIDSVDSMESGLTSSEDFAPAPPARFTPKRLFAVGAGLLGVAGCAAAALHGSASTSAASSIEHISARSLLEHPDFIDAAANNVWSVAGHQLAGKEHKLRPAMHDVMSKVTKILDEHDPEGGRQLEAVKLTHQQKADVLSMVKRMSDKHVQKVGKEILDIAVKHQSDKEGALEKVQSEISSVFQPRLAELQALQTNVVPASLRHGEDTFPADVPVEQRRLSSHCKGDDSECHPGSEITPAMAKGMSMKIEDALGIVGALLEQARLALDESAVIGSSFGSTRHVPFQWRSLIGGAAFGVETLDCFMRQNDVHKMVHGKEVLVNGESDHVNSVKMSMCPMKYAGAGMDFLSGLNNVVGIQNTKLPQDFQMMFGGHSQQPQAGYSPYGAAPNPFAMFMPQQQAQPTAHPLAHLANGFMNGMMQNQAAAGQPPAHAFAYAR